MKGVPGVGKTYQTRRFMVDWAQGTSHKHIDFIVPLDFSELNSSRDKVETMKDLLCHSLNPNEEKGFCNYNECKVLFVLDGLERCELPLDFANNKELTDLKEAASMDVLLTNLIKGKLLPSALLWIISQPSGADKIPPEYIQRVTECRETLERRQKLISALRKRFKENIQDEDMNHSHQKTTEHVLREDRSSEANHEEKKGGAVAKSVTQVHSVSDIFKDTKGQAIRNVLTTGEAGIGKSVCVQKFIKEWAKNDQRSVLTGLTGYVRGKAKVDDEVIFPLNFSALNLRREEKVSLLGLLNHFFKETKDFVISNFEQLKVLFVLDGLDAFQPALDFNNNTLTYVQESASVDVLLTNLIRGNLLPSARLWITSRPEAAKQLPDDCVNRTSEIRFKPHLASQWSLKSQLKEQFTRVSEGIDMQKTSSLLNDIYTDLYIIEGERGEVNDQHETRQIEGAKFKPEETSIKYHAIFEPALGKNKQIRSVLTTGVAGIGKSFATMKYMLDWAENKSSNDVFFMFPLSFRELNLRKEENYSLEELIHSFFPGMKTSEIKDYDKYRILIVLDGFDECRLDLVFNESEHWSDVKKPNSVKVLLTNLIQGNLLSKAQIWLTSRPAASNNIPVSKVDRVTEVRGFNDEQKEEYFKKRFEDKDLAEKILSHVKNSRTLYIMCHIPVFCWLTSKVLEDFVIRKEEGRMPSTLTDMYIYFLLLQCRQANVKYGGDETSQSSETDCWNTRNKNTVVSLGKLAFDGLEKGDLVFTEEVLTECGIEITEAAVFSGLFTQIKREGREYQQKLFCFVHMSIQEFLAAFYVFHTFNNSGENLLTKPTSTVADLPASDFYKKAVDKALGSKNGDWDMFLRFLLGLSLETNQNLLQELLKKTDNNKETNEETIGYIKEKIREENSDADHNFNLFHCLNELNDQSLVEEVKKYLHSETVTFENFSTSQWSALTFVLMTSDEKLDVFDLKKYRKSEKVLLEMLPVVKVAKTALLDWCELTEESCKGLLSSVLNSASSNLTKLDLSHNDLLDSGVKLLADGLKSLHCKLEILKLSGCQVTEKGCSFLASALRSNPASSLKQLDLSYNHPGDEGAAMLLAIKDPNMTENPITLCLDHCGQHRLKPGIKKYDGDLKFDENTAGKRLVLSDGNREVKTTKKLEEKVRRLQNEDRFKRSQVICDEGQRGLCYWEVEWKGTVGIAVAYRGVGRRWDSKGGLGCNDMSWSLLCSKDGYTAIHGKTSKYITEPFSQKVAVYLDWKAGTLTYYSDKSGELSLIHTFHAKFTEPVYPGFWFKSGSVTLCEIDETPLRWSQIKPQQPVLKEKAKAKVPKSAVPRGATGGRIQKAVNPH
uniref:NLR family CARD domain-containing protein 3-like n=1 Tax=Semicossyphus pulcher TaxID=241346 RepID=UPI0037E8ACC8